MLLVELRHPQSAERQSSLIPAARWPTANITQKPNNQVVFSANSALVCQSYGLIHDVGLKLITINYLSCLIQDRIPDSCACLKQDVGYQKHSFA